MFEPNDAYHTCCTLVAVMMSCDLKTVRRRMRCDVVYLVQFSGQVLVRVLDFKVVFVGFGGFYDVHQLLVLFLLGLLSLVSLYDLAFAVLSFADVCFDANRREHLELGAFDQLIQSISVQYGLL